MTRVRERTRTWIFFAAMQFLLLLLGYWFFARHFAIAQANASRSLSESGMSVAQITAVTNSISLVRSNVAWFMFGVMLLIAASNFIALIYLNRRPDGQRASG